MLLGFWVSLCCIILFLTCILIYIYIIYFCGYVTYSIIILFPASLDGVFFWVLGAAWIVGKFVLHYIVLNLHIDLYIYIIYFCDYVTYSIIILFPASLDGVFCSSAWRQNGF